MSMTRLMVLPEAPVWVLEDPRAAASGQASAIAGRLGLPFRRIGASAASGGLAQRMDGRVRAGSRPDIVISAGAQSAAQALLLRARHQCRVVHCASLRPRLPRGLAGYPFDLMIAPASGPDDAEPPGPADRLLTVVGSPHVVSPALLARARDLWADRLSHLPSPRIVLLLGPDSRPAEAKRLARRLARMTRERLGCVLVSVLPGCPAEAADGAVSGIESCFSLIYRHGEPDEDPTLGFLGGADAVVCAWTGAGTVSEACAGSAPVFVVRTGREGEPAASRRTLDRLIALGHARPFEASLSPWSRTPLDEAGRAARIIRRRFLTKET